MREIRASNKAEVERRYREHCRAAAANERQTRRRDRRRLSSSTCQMAAVDFSLWICKKHWHLEEAVALWLGKNPKIVNPEALDRLRRPNSPFVREFQERLNTLQRALDAGHIPTPLTPREFIAWAIHEDFALPAEFHATHRTDSSEETERRKDQSKNPDVLDRLLVGMAITHYGLPPDYNPEGNDKSRAFSLMVHDLRNVNARVDEKTLREHTKNALKRPRAKGLHFKHPPGKPADR